MSMRTLIEQMRGKLDTDGVDTVAYCMEGHGYDVKLDEIDGEAHGACPGPVLVVERNPDTEQSTPPEGGVVREAPPCERCVEATGLRFDDEGGFDVASEPLQDGVDVASEPLQDGDEEWSFTLSDGTSEMTVCLRCLASALANPSAPLALLAVRGRKVPWRA